MYVSIYTETLSLGICKVICIDVTIALLSPVALVNFIFTRFAAYAD